MIIFVRERKALTLRIGFLFIFLAIVTKIKMITYIIRILITTLHSWHRVLSRLISSHVTSQGGDHIKQSQQSRSVA
jgi:hypothetical protein